MGKQRAFLAADTAANLHNHAFVVVRIMGKEQDFQFLLQFFASTLSGREFLLTEFLHFWFSAHHFQRIGHVLLCAQICAVGIDDRLDFLLFFQIGRGLFGVGIEVGLFCAGA